MNKAQFDLIAERLIKSPVQRDAVKPHVVDGISAYKAEKIAYDRTTGTVSRDAKRILEMLEFCKAVASSD